MHKEKNLSRRQFLKSTGSITGATFLRVGAPSFAAITQAACNARDEGAAFAVLTADEARDFEAIAARLIPTTDTPGATEAGVIHFFDNAFAAEMASMLNGAREGLAAFNESLAERHAATLRLADLTPNEQDAFLATQEFTEFFMLCREMTIYGFFAMSEYGGNRNHVGWNLIGFEGEHGAWDYPFGYYDAERAKERSDGG